MVWGKFKNFKKVITDKNYIKLVYCTRWNKNKIEDFYDTVDMFKKYNPNIHILSIINTFNYVFEQKALKYSSKKFNTMTTGDLIKLLY